MKEYNKLVRDKIPEIIEANNKSVVVKILDDSEYLVELHAKLFEELGEYKISENVEELADIVEVIYAILRYKGISINDFHCLRKAKLAKNGSFDKKYFLMKVYDHE